MNRKEFLLEVMSLYTNLQSTQGKAEAWKRAYEVVLPENFPHYQKLYEKMLFEYQSTSTAPTPAYLSELRCKVQRDILEAEIKTPEPIKAHPPTKEWQEFGEKLKKLAEVKKIRKVIPPTE